MVTKNLWIPALFTPVLFRNNSGGWAVPDSVQQNTLIDRLRIMLNLDDAEGVDNRFAFPDSYEEDLEFSRDS